MSGSHQSAKPHASMRTAKITRVALSVMLCFPALTEQSRAQANRCSQARIDKLEEESDRIHDWSKLRDFYHRYSVCKIDDAEVTEGVSESVARLLADHWEKLPVAANIFKQDPAFETFALAGINITDSTDDLKHIDKLANDHCPANLHRLCSKIRKSIRDNN